MCTAPQNIYVPRGGIDTADGHLSFDQVAAGLAEGVTSSSAIPRVRSKCSARSQNDGMLRRLDAARALGKIVLDTRSRRASGISGRRDPHAADRASSTAADRATYLNEWFGPIAFIIATDWTDQSLAIARDAVVGHGALTLSVYSTSEDVIDSAIDVAEDAGVALSINLTGGVFVNQSAAFSDFHGTGANPAANAALTDAAFVANRFRVVQHRRHV